MQTSSQIPSGQSQVHGPHDDPPRPPEPLHTPEAKSQEDVRVPESNSDRFITVVSKPGEFGRAAETVYQCPRCDKQYMRIDHIKRHYRSHENERPYKCTLCSKSFNRKDLLERHRTTHPLGDGFASGRSKRKSRTAKACHRCIVAKAKCSDDRPCKRCKDRGLSCGFVAEKGQSSSPRGPSTVSADLSEHEAEDNAITPTRQDDTVYDDHSASQPFHHDNGLSARSISNAEVDNNVNAAPSRHATTRDPRYISAAMGPPYGIMQSYQGWNLDFEDSFPYLLDPVSLSKDSALGLGDDQLLAMDLDWSALTDHFMLDSGQDLGQPVDLNLNPNAPGGQGRARRFGSRVLSSHEAFKRSPWLWDPDPLDSASTEEAPQLSEADEQWLLPRVTGERPPAPMLPTCGSSARDAILLLVQHNSSSNVNLRTFPSIKMLNFLLWAFLTRETAGKCSFVHAPLLAPDQCRAELLSAMIAAGATAMGTHPFWKLGLALQERTRMALIGAFDHDNSLVRSVEVIQASLLWIEAGLWSGSRRKMEVAESAANNVPTMIRRAGAFQQGYYDQQAFANLEDSGEVLHRKWVKWAELEAYKRSILRALIDDVQSSVAYTRSPCFYSTEINFSLPTARALWEAKSAQEWKNLCLAKQDLSKTPPLTLLDVVQDPICLVSAAELHDCELAGLVALHCFWPQIASLLDAKTLYQGTSRPLQSNAGISWLEAQRQDIYKRLTDIRETMRSAGMLSAEAHTVCELFMMSLYISPSDTQKFAGRFGAKVSRAMIPDLQTWFATDEPRYATWHAGQVLRAAHSMSPAQLHGFYATAVYQASLTLTLPFLLSSDCFPSSGTSPEFHDGSDENSIAPTPQQANNHDKDQRANLIVVNGRESLQSKIYLLTGEGSPALCLGNETRSISDVEIISSAMAEIFQNNHSSTADDALPPLAEKLVTLVTDLTRATRGED